MSAQDALCFLCDPVNSSVERGAELIEKYLSQTIERANINGVLETRKRRLTGRIVTLPSATGNQLEHRIAAEQVVIVLVGVVGQNAENPHANHLQKCVIHERLMPQVVECVCKLIGQADLFANWRIGNKPASLVNCPAAGSNTIGFVPKKSNDFF